MNVFSKINIRNIVQEREGESMKIAIGGQLNKNEIKDYINAHGEGKITCEIFTDMDAAMKVKTGEYDYYVGACQSGAGGALGMAYAILGRDRCITIGMAGIAPKEEKVIEGFKKDCKAFGFTNDQVDIAMKYMIQYLLKM